MHFNGMIVDNLPTQRSIHSEAEVSGITKMQGSKSSVEVSCLDLNPTSASIDRICEEHFGERPLSFRSVMKRFVTQFKASNTTSVSADYGLIRYSGPIFPAPAMAYGNSSFAFVEFFSYLRYAYLGVKGSIRYRYRTLFGYGSRPNDRVTVSLKGLSSTTTAATLVTTHSPTVGTFFPLSTLYGSLHYVPATNGGIEFELPLYTNNLFLLAFSDTLDDLGSTNNMELAWFRDFQVESDYCLATAVGAVAVLEVATGEDFTFLRFQGAPYYTAGVVS